MVLHLAAIITSCVGITYCGVTNAHRTGKRSADCKYHRHIIARFHSRVIRGNVMRSTPNKLNNSPYRFVDDLTQTDLMAKESSTIYGRALQGQQKNHLSGTANCSLRAERLHRKKSTDSWTNIDTDKTALC